MTSLVDQTLNRLRSGSAPKYEYRVCWTREERARRTQIMQSRRGAEAKAERLKTIDAELAGDWCPGPYEPEKHPLEGMPPLVGEPIIERRVVGEWEAA